MHGARPSAIDISIVGTKGRYFKLETAFHHEDHPKMRTNRIGARKEFLHNFWLGIGGDIEVFRRLAADDIADATASEVRDMTALPQTRGNFSRRLFHRRKRSVFHRIYSSGGLRPSHI